MLEVYEGAVTALASSQGLISAIKGSLRKVNLLETQVLACN